MKEASLGLNHLLSFFATCHTVRPRSSALSSGHLRIAPPKSSSDMPKCFRYHAVSAALSPLLLKKTPPTPVTFAIVVLLPVWCGASLGFHGMEFYHRRRVPPASRVLDPARNAELRSRSTGSQTPV